MKTRILWLSLALTAGQASHAFAQGSAQDALRYSQLQFGGPARTQGIAGANVALGADFGNLSSNPAGLGLFQKSEFHFSPGLGLGSSNARIEGNPSGAQEGSKNSFHVGSLGVVFAGRRPDDDQTSNWRGGGFGLGFTRVADFNTASLYEGTVSNNQSYLAYFRPDAAAARTPAAFASLDKQFDDNRYTTPLGLTYGTYLSNIRSNRAGVDSAVVLRQQGSVLTQSELIRNAGSISQLDLGYGANYRNRLYIGGAIGFVSSNHTQFRTLRESDNDAATHFNSLTNEIDRKTTGSGFNVRAGIIYRANDLVRFGASMQTPTFMRMTYSYGESLRANYSAQGSDRVPRDLPVGDSPTVSLRDPDYAYRITTPFRANGGVAVTVGKHGFVTGDAEYVNYGQARLYNDPESVNGDNYSFSDENADVRNRYQSAVNLRAGAEGRFDVFRVRAGYARYGDPFKDNANGGRVQTFYTLGAGIRQGNFFIDAAGVYASFNQQYTPYTLETSPQINSPLIKISNSRYTTSVTAGFTF